DLNRAEVRGVEAQHLFGRQLRGVEAALPLRVRETADADVEVHGLPFREVAMYRHDAARSHQSRGRLVTVPGSAGIYRFPTGARTRPSPDYFFRRGLRGEAGWPVVSRSRYCRICSADRPARRSSGGSACNTSSRSFGVSFRKCSLLYWRLKSSIVNAMARPSP